VAASSIALGRIRSALPSRGSVVLLPAMDSPVFLNRRDALKLGLGTVVGCLVGSPPAGAEGQTAAKPPPQPGGNVVARTDPTPLVDARFPSEIAENVWIIPDRRIFLVPNIGIIVGKKAALVIDCGLGPECGRRALEAAKKIAPARKLILTQTHAHPEHVFGAMAFRDRAEIFLNRQQNDYLVKTGPALLRSFRERFGEDIKHLLEGAEVVPATHSYDGDNASLDLGERQVEFRAFGTAHSPGDQTIFLPKERILFAGDLIEERMFPIVPFFPPTITKSDIDVSRWSQALSEMEQLSPSIIVPGHGSLGQAEIARAIREYFADVQNRVTKRAEGESTDTLVSELRPQIESAYASWEHERFIEPALRYFATG
jgi:glyoxylase-like metal-dependent hydrolase (beta-lactamase superfamily II)